LTVPDTNGRQGLDQCDIFNVPWLVWRIPRVA